MMVVNVGDSGAGGYLTPNKKKEITANDKRESGIESDENSYPLPRAPNRVPVWVYL
jgi:hypothetical protein